jgi:hypothetical protein
MDVARPHHRLGLIAPRLLRFQTTFNSTLAVADDFAVVFVHSKCSFWLDWMTLAITIKPRIYGHFEFFYPQPLFPSRLFKD